MTPFPHLKEASQEAGGNPGVWKFKKKLSMNLKETFFWDTLYDKYDKYDKYEKYDKQRPTTNERQWPTTNNDQLQTTTKNKQ